MGELDRARSVAFPLRGQWTVQQTPAHRIPSHGTDILGMRYAYDFRPVPADVHGAGRGCAGGCLMGDVTPQELDFLTERFARLAGVCGAGRPNRMPT